MLIGSNLVKLRVFPASILALLLASLIASPAGAQPGTAAAPSAPAIATLPGMPPVVDPANLYSEASASHLSPAVRNALPRFRFEPARSATAGSKPQVAWVEFRAAFTGRN